MGKDSQPLKLQQNIIFFVTNLHKRKALRKLVMQLEIPICVGYGPKSSNV